MIRTVDAPEQAADRYPFSQKVFAAAQAEADSEEEDALLAWVDEDTVFLSEPHEFVLPDGINFGYRPAMHQNIAPLWGTPLDAFWRRIYDLLSVPAEALFSMVTPADEAIIYPWINAGCLVVRPEYGLLRQWAESWPILYLDPELRSMCETDVRRRIFLYQAALTCAVIRETGSDDRLELSSRVNYPVFFKEMFGGKHDFDDLTDVVSFRHESYFRNPAPDWQKRLKGPADRIDWIREHIAQGA